MIINNKNIDYLAELVVSHLMTSRGIDDSGIFIHLIGVFHRFFSFDIEKVRRHRNEAGGNKSGIQDAQKGRKKCPPILYAPRAGIL